MKNKSLNRFAINIAKKQLVDLKLMSKIKGGSEPPPLDECAICGEYYCKCG